MIRLSWLLPIFALHACGESQRSAGQVTRSPAGESAAISGAPAQPAGASARASRFTTLDDKGCGPERVIEETGDWDRDCKGAGGQAFEWASGDLREDLIFVRGEARTNLQIPIIVANGAFNALGKTIEWRGPAGGEPDVLVVRVHVANAEGKNDSGRLAVARLKPAPCIVAVVPVGAGQSERARAIADGKLPDCLAAAD